MLSTIAPNYKAVFPQCPVYSLDPQETHKVVILVNLTFAANCSAANQLQVYFVNGRVDSTEVEWLQNEIENICRIQTSRDAFSAGNYDPLQLAIIVRVQIGDVPDEGVFYPPPPGYQLPPHLRLRSTDSSLLPAASPSPSPGPSSTSGFYRQRSPRYWNRPTASADGSSSSSASSASEASFPPKSRKRKRTARRSIVQTVEDGAVEEEDVTGSEPSPPAAEATTDTSL